MLEISDIWKLACSELTKKLAESNFNLWISPIVPLSLDKETLVLGVPNETYVWWLGANFKDFIQDAIEATSNMKLSVKFEAAPVQADQKVQVETKENKATTSEKDAVSISSASLENGSDKLALDRRFTFDSFVVGDSNKFAYSACMTVASEPGAKINPLFIHSSTGLGKTHLLRELPAIF